MSTTIRPSARPVRAGAAGPAGTRVVVGVDLGTTSAKVIAVDEQLRVWAGAANAYPLLAPSPGWAEQDPDTVADAAVAGLTGVVDAVREHGAVVSAVALSAAMHSVLGVNEQGSPVTPAMTYADSRAAEQAAALRGTADGLALYHRTGVPHHSMAPLFKLAWFTQHRPDTAARVARWMSLKEYLLARLGGSAVVDHSIASGTGLFDLARRRWDPEALRRAGVAAAQLSPLVSTTTVVEVAGLDVPVAVGGGDGALANLGAGAVAPGIGALSIGTSGAVRVVSSEPTTDAAGQLFCAALDDEHWVVGGAISNGGLVLRWLRDQLFAAGGTPPTYGDLTALADAVPPGADGLLFCPSLTAERAPQWDGSIGGSLVDIDLRHGAGHVVRAAMEGVALRLRWVAEVMATTDMPLRRIHATGGFTASAVWVQILADVLGREIVVPVESEGSSLGAALLGMVALGWIPSVDEAANRVPVGSVITPRGATSEVYAGLYERFRSLSST